MGADAPLPIRWATCPALILSTALRALIGDPNYAAKNWVFEQYDTMVMADTPARRASGAGIVRVHGTDKSIAFTSDVTPRYVFADPVEGGGRPSPKPTAICAPWARGRWPPPTT